MTRTNCPSASSAKPPSLVDFPFCPLGRRISCRTLPTVRSRCNRTSFQSLLLRNSPLIRSKPSSRDPFYDLLKREIELLESLTDLKDADNILKAEKDGGDAIHALDSRFQGLGMQEMKPLPLDSQEFSEINQYLLNTRGETHHVNYTVQDIFRIERQGELERFQESGYASIASDRRLLWHGSRATNFGGILGQGLRIAPPEAPVSGYMFDKGTQDHALHQPSCRD